MHIISIIGPTGVGKTAVALALATQLIQHKEIVGVDIISADSRQVYKDIPILSGADVPDGFLPVSSSAYQQQFFVKEQIRLHGVGILAAQDSWSLGQFQSLFHEVYAQAVQQHRAVIVVGGTTLYHKQLLQTDARLHVLPNAELRAELATLSLAALQARLGALNPEHWQTMNNSDRANPRRLVRAIEQTVAAMQAAPEVKGLAKKSTPKQIFLFVTTPSAVLHERIAARVQQRFAGGVVAEVQRVLQLASVSEQLTSACGFVEIEQYLNKKLPVDECIAQWLAREIRYTKAQYKWQSQFADALQLRTETATWRDDLLMLLQSVY